MVGQPHTVEGDVVEADLLVVAVGAEPDEGLAGAAGLALDPVHGGVAVDADCRTSADGIFAAGDIASRLDPRTGRRARGEHVDNANRHGAAVARAVLSEPVAEQDPPWFWSDQYELALQFVGRPPPHAAVVVRGSVADRDFTAFYLAEGRVHAAFAVDRTTGLFRKSWMPDRRDAVEFHNVARSGQVPEGMVRGLLVGDVEVAVPRSAGTVYATSNHCSHLGGGRANLGRHGR